jgi:hypothetical protein
MKTKNIQMIILSSMLMGMMLFQSASAQHVLMAGWGDGAPNDNFLLLMENHLKELGCTVTQSDTMPDDISTYDILFLMGGGKCDDIPESEIDQFVGAGGGLILFEGIVKDGCFDVTANSNPVSKTEGWEQRTNITVVDPGHDLCQGLDTTEIYSGYSTEPVMKAGSHVLIRWDDQTVFAAVYEWGSGRVIYLNWLNAWYYNYWGQEVGRIGRLFMTNALEWLFPGTGVNESPEIQAVGDFALKQNFPNPFNSSTTITYSVPNSDFITLKIYDLLGREIYSLVNEFQNTGMHSVNFNASELSSGIYFYKLQLENSFSETKKMLLIR